MKQHFSIGAIQWNEVETKQFNSLHSNLFNGFGCFIHMLNTFKLEVNVHKHSTVFNVTVFWDIQRLRLHDCDW